MLSEQLWSFYDTKSQQIHLLTKEKPQEATKNKLNLWLIGVLAIANKNDSYDWSKKAVNIALKLVHLENYSFTFMI